MKRQTGADRPTVSPGHFNLKLIMLPELLIRKIRAVIGPFLAFHMGAGLILRINGLNDAFLVIFNRYHISFL